MTIEDQNISAAPAAVSQPWPHSLLDSQFQNKTCQDICQNQFTEILSGIEKHGLPPGKQLTVTSLIKDKVLDAIVGRLMHDKSSISQFGSGYGSDHGDDGHVDHTFLYLGFMSIAVILIAYAAIGSYMELKMFRWGHETGVIIVIGVVVSIIIEIIEVKDLKVLQWSNELFFDLLLPLIIFTTGYNIRRKKFFSNFVNISKFGLLGTLLTFVFLTVFTYLLFRFFELTKHNYSTGETEIWTLDILSILYMCAILTGSDIIAFVTLVKFEEYPSLFSIVLGEGLYNDVIVVIMYETMKKVAENEEENHGVDAVHTPLEVVFDFFKISICSILFGLIAGTLCTLMTKYMRFLSQSAVFECTILVSWAMIGYYISEMLGFSAICSLLVTSIIYSHYTWYNLSPQGQHVSALTFQTLGYMAEALVFAYIGLNSCFYILNYWVSWEFIIAQLVFVILARTMGIFISYYTFSCCKGSPDNKLSNREIMFAVWAAYIRGAIAFGLSQNLSDKNFGSWNEDFTHFTGQTQVVQSTILSLVIITTFFFGGFTPMVKQCLMGSNDDQETDSPVVEQLKDGSDIGGNRYSQFENKMQPSVKTEDLSQLIDKQSLKKANSLRASFDLMIHGKGVPQKARLVDKIMMNKYMKMREQQQQQANQGEIHNVASKEFQQELLKSQKEGDFKRKLTDEEKKNPQMENLLQKNDTMQFYNKNKQGAQQKPSWEHMTNRKSDVNKSESLEDEHSDTIDSNLVDQVQNKLADHQKTNNNTMELPTEGQKLPSEYQASDHTHYHEFLHPNLHKQATAISKMEGKVQPKFIQWLSRMDSKYVRPCLIYKYRKQKKRIEFEFEDVLKEYQAIEDELNRDSSDEEDGADGNKSVLPSEWQAMSHEVASDAGRQIGNFGLLSQYIMTKMAKEAVGEMYMSHRMSGGGQYFNRLSQQSGAPQFAPMHISNRKSQNVVSNQQRQSQSHNASSQRYSSQHQNMRNTKLSSDGGGQFEAIIEENDQESAMFESQKQSLKKDIRKP